MTFPDHFEGPHRTLFLREKQKLRIVTGSGGEAILPLADFLTFLLHLTATAQHTATLALAGRAERLTRLIIELTRAHHA